MPDQTNLPDQLRMLVVEPDMELAPKLEQHLASEPTWEVDVVPSLVDAGMLAERLAYDVVVVGPGITRGDPDLVRSRAAVGHLPMVAIPGLFAAPAPLAAQASPASPAGVPADAPVAGPAEPEFHLRLWPRLSIVEVNEAAADLFGFSIQSLRAKPARLFDAVDPQDMRSLEAALQSAMSAPATAVFGLRGDDGVVRRLQVDLVAVPGAVDEPVVLRGVVAVATNDDEAAVAQVEEAGSVVPTTAPVRDVPIERRDVSNLVAGIVGMCEVGNRRLSFEGEMSVLRMEPSTIERAVRAAIANARRHTPEGARVHVTVARSMSGVLVTIRDDGPGVQWPAGVVPGRHGIVDVEDVVAHGGRGLSAFAEAARAHEGRATVQSQDGQGTTVRLVLNSITQRGITSTPLNRVVASA